MTAWLNVKNNAESALASAVTAADTTLTLVSGEGSKFPSSNFNITIDDEILTCSSRSGDVLTVTRAQEGTAAAVHAAGAIVSLNVTAAVIEQLQSAIDAVSTENKSCRVYHSVAQTIPTGVVTVLAFDSERWDTDSIHDNVTNNTRLTCKTAGLYLITAHVGFTANANGRRSIYLKKNNTTWIGIVGLPSVPDGVTSTLLEVTTQYQLDVDDFVEVYCYQNSGGDLTVAVNPEYCPEFMMARIG